MAAYSIIADDPEFLAFWKAYPRKLCKGDARKAWHQTAPIRPSLDILLAAIKAAANTEQWTRDRGQFVPYPATWLRAERWDDVHEIEKPVKEWYQTAQGVEAKGAELGIKPDQFQNWPTFKQAVLQRARN